MTHRPALGAAALLTALLTTLGGVSAAAITSVREPQGQVVRAGCGDCDGTSDPPPPGDHSSGGMTAG